MGFYNRGNRTSRGAAALTALSFAAWMATPPQVGAQQAPAPAQASQSQLEQIVVTASRQGEQNIQDIPMAISAIAPQSLEIFGLSGMEDYSRMVPSLNLQQLGPGINKIDIRGITTSGIDYTDVQDRPLLQGGPERTVQPVLQVELALPADHVREQVAVERRVGGQDAVQVEDILGRDQLVQPDRARGYLRPLPRGPGMIGVGPPLPDLLEHHTAECR